MVGLALECLAQRLEFCCVLGFALAWRRRAWITLSWVVVVEVVLALWIRDNLTLNIIMLIHPIQAIKAWQMGA